MSWSNSLASLVTLVRDRIEQWESHGQPNAAQVLADHPELRDARSLVMDLALAEYALRKESGEPISMQAFCDQFPDYRKSLVHLLEVQDYLDRCPEFADSPLPARWPIPGDTFLGYEIVEPLGRGGLARVFLAREQDVGNRFVVIKVSSHGDHEAQTLGKLSHPSIVPIHTVKHDADGDWTVICMPLIGAATGIDLLDAAFGRGGALRNAALVSRVAGDTRPLTPLGHAPPETGKIPWYFSYSDAVCLLALDIAEALDVAHQAGVLHRDIKPSNILLSWSGRAMLLDFNLSIRDELPPQRLGGTLAYMAPEVIEGLLEQHGQGARRFDPRCDVYSLGVVLFELLTGRLPFEPADAERLKANACGPWLASKRSEPASALLDRLQDAAVDQGLALIVHKCIAADPAERYADAAGLAAALRAHLSGVAVARRLATRKRRELVGVLVALAACIVGVVAFVGSRPSKLDVLYGEALAHYEAGEFKRAEAKFTGCLGLRAGWPQALFGRAQSLRRQGQWQAARADYVALANVEPAWAYALAGYCCMQANDYQTAWFDFQRAYAKGMRDKDSLMNYAKVCQVRSRRAEAIRLYSEILEANPSDADALKERALAHIAMVINDPKLIPAEEAFADAHRYYEIDKTFDGAFLAALVYGEAGRKEKKYEAEAFKYLNEAIERGLPKHNLEKLPRSVRWLSSKLDRAVVASAKDGAMTHRTLAGSVRHPPQTAYWSGFLSKFGFDHKLVAGSE